ncbi:diphosphomevalonate decarboxylase [candidate division KSB1 bacterium]|nr:diphosphomevalonate decarboxylase [candidate division KSB1 bacterium]
MEYDLAKASAIAHSNIALIKYWGRSAKFPPELNMPLNDTISMTKRGVTHDTALTTHTTIEFSPHLDYDEAVINDEPADERTMDRICFIINALRKQVKMDWSFFLRSYNDFPTQAGLASSASGFAALTLAATEALQLNVSKQALSRIARLGSGSACRSIHGGIVFAHRGESHETAFAEQLCAPDDFDIAAVIAVVDQHPKKITSDVGHDLAKTSLFNDVRIEQSQIHAIRIKRAVLGKDFATVGQVAELNCLMMHAVMMTSSESLLYWQPATLAVIHRIHALREEGIECYFTIDAGPNVHCLCQYNDIERVQQAIQDVKGVLKTFVAIPGGDAYITEAHLF